MRGVGSGSTPTSQRFSLLNLYASTRFDPEAWTAVDSGIDHTGSQPKFLVCAGVFQCDMSQISHTADNGKKHFPKPLDAWHVIEICTNNYSCKRISAAWNEKQNLHSIHHKQRQWKNKTEGTPQMLLRSVRTPTSASASAQLEMKNKIWTGFIIDIDNGKQNWKRNLGVSIYINEWDTLFSRDLQDFASVLA